MSNIIKEDGDVHYKSTITRRESLKWLGILSASTLIPSIVGCEDSEQVTTIANAVGYSIKGHWPDLTLSPITVKGYGKDPSMIIPPKSPWPKTLTAEQLTLVAVLADILVPRDGHVPSATEVNVPDVVDEWVSAPYERQQSDRLTILSALVWLNDEAKLRFSKAFTGLSTADQLNIIDDIAYQKEDLAEEFTRISRAFSRFRKLVLAAFFCSPEGTKDLGYLGNVPIAGDYPGPTDEAMIHLDKTLYNLGLTLA
ncbi:gluconate 2-dehydrogenase subunit 3 family protein [Colwellia sp. Bg11-12]|uniref:gluconate 2-dehydrogenase subunit 3 family protein n=1 Tax=Colwellia sp. Bg11-12 TaxID=2759817 RepID=UPI0015F47371|nr:gluconate 2-dehydrogenase subunit 3 family protein [Colwellia sp. Bg11-12]MBA6264232.1 gluconate 2-dehydrogenase subunit 3 family protein [Colwellia sp. Bg11-12]